MSFNNIQLSFFCHSENNQRSDKENDTKREVNILLETSDINGGVWRHSSLSLSFWWSKHLIERTTYAQCFSFDNQNEWKDLSIKLSIFSLTYMFISLWEKICSNENQSNTQKKIIIMWISRAKKERKIDCIIIIIGYFYYSKDNQSDQNAFSYDICFFCHWPLNKGQVSN